jgi:hypothetical protein
MFAKEGAGSFELTHPLRLSEALAHYLIKGQIESRALPRAKTASISGNRAEECPPAPVDDQ